MIKSLFKSWTIWFGIFQVATGVLGLISNKMDVAQAQTLIITGFGTIGFRVKTTESVFNK